MLLELLYEQEEDPKAPMTNDDILGDPIPDEQQREMQKLCYCAIGVVSSNTLLLESWVKELVISSTLRYINSVTPMHICVLESI